MKYYISKTNPGTGFFASIHKIEKGHFTTAHWHDCIELEYVLDGSGVHNLNGEERSFSKGCFWILGTTDYHSITFSQNTEIINISLSPDITGDKVCEALTSAYPVTGVFNAEDDENEILSLAKSLTEQQENDIFFKEYGKSIINLVCIELLRKTNTTFKKSGSTVKKAVEYAEKNFRKDINLKSVSREIGLSPNYLSMLFAKEYSVTFTQYLTHLRLKHACRLLLDTEFSSKQVCFECGFNSYEYFYAVFKKCMGTTPGAYKKAK